MKNPFHISNFIKDLSMFRPLSAQQVQAVRDSIAQAKKLVAKEKSYLPENQNKAYIEYLTNHIKMLYTEIEIATGTTISPNKNS